MKERSEWARKTEERRLDKLKVYTVSEEIQTLGKKQAALVDKMIQDLFALTPEWEIRRMKARAVSMIHLFPLVASHPRSFASPVVQSQSRQCESTLDQLVNRWATRPPGKKLNQLGPCNTTYSYSSIFLSSFPTTIPTHLS
jgi:hypothetical protein